MSYTYPHLSMLDTTTQTIASAGTPQVITFNTTLKADKIAVTSSSRFTVNEAGVTPTRPASPSILFTIQKIHP